MKQTNLSKWMRSSIVGTALLAMSGCGGDGAAVSDYNPESYQLNTSEVVATSTSHTCVIDKAQNLWCFGDDYAGEVTGNGERNDVKQLTPIEVLPGEKFKFVGATGGATFAIKNDGTLWSWGQNTYGQRGIDKSSDRQGDWKPLQIGEDADWRLVRGSGSNHGACAVKESGTLWCWGDNRDAQVGNGGATGQEDAPVQVGTDSDWMDVSLAVFSACGVKEDQTLWCWGASSAVVNEEGEFEGRSSHEPAAVLADKKIRSMDVNGGNGCALTTESELYCWGSNSVGQLLGTPPVAELLGTRKIAANDNWKKITVVGGTFCGLGQGGTVECWGSNLAGSLGRGIADADLRETTTVAPVVFDGIFTDLTGGLASVYGRTIDGELYGWGHNGAYGKLGQGTTQLEYTTPVSITLE